MRGQSMILTSIPPEKTENDKDFWLLQHYLFQLPVSKLKWLIYILSKIAIDHITHFFMTLFQKFKVLFSLSNSSYAINVSRSLILNLSSSQYSWAFFTVKELQNKFCIVNWFLLVLQGYSIEILPSIIVSPFGMQSVVFFECNPCLQY